jgi:ATP-dependent RNA helicase DeaD
MTFAELGAHPTLRRALDQKGYTQPTPVQAAVLAPGLARRDLLVSAETGSGKTVAFGLAIAPTIMGEDAELGPAGRPRALVIAPTRELALQVQRELTWLYAGARGRVAACVGGMEMRRELRALHEGAHIVVGTPGRLVDHLERGSLVLSELKALVLDEADEMLDMGFRDELERILSDASPDRRTLLFSATIPPEIERLASRYQRDAQRIATSPTHVPHRDIEYRAHLIAAREREHAVVNVLRTHDATGAIVFCRTRESVTHLHANLTERGFQAVAISGELTQPERTRAIKALRDGRARVLVATDVAARGLDLPDVSLVIHADLPLDAQVLQHRSGRTGRAGRKGVSVLLVPSHSRRAADRILHQARIKPVWSPVPAADQIRSLDEGRILREILALPLDLAEEDVAVARKLLAERTPEQIGALLSAIHRARLPEPEDLPLTASLPTVTRPPRPHAAPHAPVAKRPHSRSTEPGQSTWFSINVGRSLKADPKWLVPLICRRGGVTKAEIGAIRIFADETRVEIASSAAERFAAASRRPDRQDPRIRFSPSSPPTTRPPSHRLVRAPPREK